MAHGNIYAAEKIDAALSNYFRPGNLGALRELALLWVADRVDEALHGYRGAPRHRRRVGDPRACRRRAHRRARRRGAHPPAVAAWPAASAASWSASTSSSTTGCSDGPGPSSAAQRQLVRELGGEVYEVVGHDPVAALVEFARNDNATQLVLGASRRSRWHELVHGSFVARLARQATRRSTST